MALLDETISAGDPGHVGQHIIIAERLNDIARVELTTGTGGVAESDNSAAMQEMLDRVEAKGGGMIELPGAGNTPFSFANPIRIPNNAGIRGQGDQATVIKAASGMNYDMFVGSKQYGVTDATPVTAPPIYVEKLQIHGNRSGQTGGDGFGLVSMNYRSRFERVRVFNSYGDGIVIARQNQDGIECGNGLVEPKIIYCDVTDAGGHGFHALDPADPTHHITDGFIDHLLVNGTGGGNAAAVYNAILLEASAGWHIFHPHTYGLTGGDCIRALSVFALQITHPYLEHFGTSTVAGTYSGIFAQGQAGRGCEIAGGWIHCDENETDGALGVIGNAASNWRHIRIEAAGATTVTDPALWNVHDVGIDSDGVNAVALYIGRSTGTNDNRGNVSGLAVDPELLVPYLASSAGAVANMELDVSNSFLKGTAAPVSGGPWPPGTFFKKTNLVNGGSPGWYYTTTPGWRAAANVA